MEMPNFSTWITTLLLCSGCVLSHNVKADRYNVATLQAFLNKEQSETAVTSSNLKNEVVFAPEEDTEKFASTLKANQRYNGNQRVDFGKLYARKPIGDIDEYINNYIALLEDFGYRQSSGERRQEIDNFIMEMHNYYKQVGHLANLRPAVLSGSNSPIYRGKKKIVGRCTTIFDCPVGSDCEDFKCICFPYHISDGHTCVVAEIGSQCEEKRECPPSAECKAGKCACPDDFYGMGYTCIPREHQCKNDNDCLEILKNSTCIIKEHGDLCECQPSNIPTTLGCLPIANLGDSCEDTSQCPESSKCDNGTCVCVDGHVNVSNQCIKKKEDECYNDTDCEHVYLKNSYCDLRVFGNICLCLSGPLGYITSRTECLPKVKLGETCKLSRQCPLGSACIADTCICKSDYITEGKACVKPKVGSCKEFKICPVHSKCIKGFCVCNDGYVKRNNDCVEKKVHDRCYNDYDCQDNWNNSTCKSTDDGNECQCPPGYLIGITECLPKRNVGESCELSLQCPFMSVCRNDICVCDDSYIRKGHECVRRELGDPCTLSEHCPSYSDCDWGICTCQHNRVSKEGSCVKSKAGDSCNWTKECPIGGLCLNGACVCNNDYKERNKLCVSKYVGGDCQSTEECPERTYCEYGICQCKSIYDKKGLKCVNKVLPLSASSGVPKYVWPITAAAVVVIICLCVWITVVRRRRTLVKNNGLPHNEATSSMAESRYPVAPPPLVRNNALPYNESTSSMAVSRYPVAPPPLVTNNSLPQNESTSSMAGSRYPATAPPQIRSNDSPQNESTSSMAGTSYPSTPPPSYEDIYKLPTEK